VSKAVTADASNSATHELLCCSAIAGPLFVTVFVIEGARRPDYKPLRHPVSSLALGSRRQRSRTHDDSTDPATQPGRSARRPRVC
jgi:hypothetical protein